MSQHLMILNVSMYSQLRFIKYHLLLWSLVLTDVVSKAIYYSL